jgi:hypothetical protein
MGVVQGFEHDMFVSYAHQDNVPAVGRDSGWVVTLVTELEREVRQRLGRKEFGCWMDYQLDENLPVSNELVLRVQKSATLLVVISPTYLNSAWCRRERESFLENLADRVGRGDVFVVNPFAVPYESFPSEFGSPAGFSFSSIDPRTRIARTFDIGLGVSSSLAEQYATAVVNLSEKIAKHIKRLSGANRDLSESAIIAMREPTTYAFVARSTEDLEEREEELKAYLGQMGVGVLPQLHYSQSNEPEFEQSMLSDLARSKVYLQLLSTVRGREMDFAAGQRYAGYQHKVALQSGKPIMLWRDRSLDVSGVKDPSHQALLEKARACGIEEFKRAASEEAHREPPLPRRVTSKVMVFVNADAADRDLARRVGRTLQDLNEIEVYYPLTSGTPEEVRTDLEDTLRTCDGVLLIYGATNARWIRYQLQQSRKVIAQRDHPLNALAVCHGPPPEDKGDLGVEIRNLVTLDCRKGIDPKVLQCFVDTLQGAGPGN